jgi:glycerophosphoryl diester phosphodiesterase
MIGRYFRLLKTWYKEYVSICPRLPKKYRENNIPFIICGHRGSPVKCVENTIPSFKQALDDGANALEIDLSITSDGHVILWHDWDPNNHVSILRETGLEPELKYRPSPPPIGSAYRKPVHLITLEEFRNNYSYKIKSGEEPDEDIHIPTITEFFSWCCADPRLKLIFFDVKAPVEYKEMAPEVIRCIMGELERHKSELEIVIESFDLPVFLEMKKAYPKCKYSLDVEPPAGFIIDPKVYSAVKVAIKEKNEYAIAFRPRKVTIANWTTFRRIIRHDIKMRYRHNRSNNGHSVEKIVGCTINKSKEMRCLVKLGIDGIQTDFPERLRKIAEKYGRNIL